MIFRDRIFLSFILIAFLLSPLWAQTLLKVDFAQARGPVKSWFKDAGWRIKGDLEDMNARFEKGTLVFEPTDDSNVLISLEFKENAFLKGVKEIKIVWGVEHYPVGADWGGVSQSKRNTRDPIAVLVSFGKEKIDSGAMLFPPDAPYFIGIFLGELEKPGIGYFGNYYQKGGRYFCESCDGSTGAFTTVMNLHQRFKDTFGKEPPDVSKITIEVDVGDTQKVNGRHSKAYIKSIELFN